MASRGRVDWRWVGGWAVKIFFACLPLGMFMYLSSAPVIRPGGVMQALPAAFLAGAAVSGVVTVIAAAVLARQSMRSGRDRQ